MRDTGCRMSFQIIRTSDGSDTIYSSSVNENYHSSHGAVQESKHIFINAGLRHVPRDGTILNILEVGFGTGLNALLTLIEAEILDRQVIYTSIEAFPLPCEIWRALNYPQMPGQVECTKIFSDLHLASWNRIVEISDLFRFEHRGRLYSQWIGNTHRRRSALRIRVGPALMMLALKISSLPRNMPPAKMFISSKGMVSRTSTTIRGS